MSACVVPTCTPQLQICQVAADINAGFGIVRSLDWQTNSGGALLAAAVGGQVNVYTFDGKTLTLQSTIVNPIGSTVESVRWLQDSNNFYLAFGTAPNLPTTRSTVFVYDLTTPSAPSLVSSVQLAGNGGIHEINWNKVPFVNLGQTAYFIAIGRRVAGGSPRLNVVSFNITTATVSLTGANDTAGGDAYTVSWLNTGGNRYIASGLSGGGGGQPPSRIGRYQFNLPAITLTLPPTNVPVEVSPTSLARVKWFSIGSLPLLASSYIFGGTNRLKVSEFTPPVTFQNNPICSVNPTSAAGGPSAIDIFSFSGNNYITLGQSATAGNSSLFVYNYTQPAGVGQYCLALSQARGDVFALQWTQIAGAPYLGIGGSLANSPGDFNLRIFAIDDACGVQCNSVPVYITING